MNRTAIAAAAILAAVSAPCLATDALARIGGFVGPRAVADPQEAAVAATATNPVPIRAASLGPDGLRAVYSNQIARTYATDANGAVFPLVVYRRASGRWTETDADQSDTAPAFRILQSLGGGLYLADRFGPDGTFAADLQRDRYADGDTVRIDIADTGETRSYAAVDGSRRTVRLYRATRPPRHAAGVPTFEDFADAIRDGVRFRVLLDAPVPCGRCGASGFVDAAQPGSKAKRRAVCPACAGKRTVVRQAVCSLGL